jgi:glycosyltransferase involved in cell wall biosynthesis
MNILMLSPHPTVRGPIPKHTPDLIEGLRRLGCSISLEYWGRHSDSETLPQKVWGRARDLLRVRRRVGEDRFDMIVVKTAHDWWTLPRDLSFLAVARKRGRPIVIQFHGSRPDRLTGWDHLAFRWATRLLLHLSDAAMVLSREELEGWKRFYPGGKFFIARNPYVPKALPRETPGPDPARQEKVILYVGRFIREKGVLDLLNAVALLKDRPGFHVSLVGDGPYKTEIVEEIRRLGLGKLVSLTGYLEGKALGAAYGSADIFVLPSWSEGFPRVLAEAMDAGMPIVTTHIRGAVDYLEQGRNALLVPVRDPVALAGALESLLSDSELRRRMSEANRERLEAFSPDVVAGEYLGILNEVLGARTVTG